MAFRLVNEDIDFPEIDKRQIKKWVNKVIEHHSKHVGEITYIFTSDRNILKVNQDFLQHDYYTDVITFDYCEENNVSGDIYISLDTVKSNSQKFDQEYSRELLRVIIHGILHLIGFMDKSDEDAKEMRQQEELALGIFDGLAL